MRSRDFLSALTSAGARLDSRAVGWRTYCRRPSQKTNVATPIASPGTPKAQAYPQCT